MLWIGLSIVTLVLVVAAAVAGGRARPRRVERRTAMPRAAAFAALAVLTAVGPLFQLLDGAPRALVGFAVLLSAPGAALVGFASIRDPLTEMALALALSLTVLIGLSQVMLLLGSWHPSGLYGLLALAAAPVLAWHGARDLELMPERSGKADVVA